MTRAPSLRQVRRRRRARHPTLLPGASSRARRRGRWTAGRRPRRTAGPRPSARRSSTRRFMLVSPPSSGGHGRRPLRREAPARGRARGTGPLVVDHPTILARRNRRLSYGDPMPPDLPDSAAVVVIGGGVGGASVAYHLAELGQTDVVLLERAELTSGSTFHSAGLVGQLRADPTLTRMNTYSVDLYRRLQRQRHPAGLGGERRDPARLVAGADGGDPPPDRLGDDVRPRPARDHRRRRRRACSRRWTPAA